MFCLWICYMYLPESDRIAVNVDILCKHLERMHSQREFSISNHIFITVIWKLSWLRKFIHSHWVLVFGYCTASALAIEPILLRHLVLKFQCEMFKLDHFMYKWTARRALYFDKDKSSINDILGHFLLIV